MRSGVHSDKQTYIIPLYVYAVLCIFFLLAGCTEVPDLHSRNDTVNPISSMRCYVDKSGMLPAEQIASFFEDNLFCTDIPQHSVSGYTDGAYWLSVQLPVIEKASDFFVLDLGPEVIDRADMYEYDSSGNCRLIDSAGRCVSNGEQRIVSWRTALELPAQIMGSTVLISIENAVPFFVFLNVYTAEDFRGQTAFFSYVHIFCIGLMSAIGIVFLFFFIIKKDKLFLSLALLSFFSMLYQCAAKGFGHCYIWNMFADRRLFSRIGYMFFMGAFASAQAAFIRILNFNSRGRPYRKDIVFIYSCSVFFTVLYMFPAEIKILYIANILFLIGYCACCSAVIIRNLLCSRSVPAVYGGCFILLFCSSAVRFCCILLPSEIYSRITQTAAAFDLYFGYDLGFLYTIIVCLSLMYHNWTERRRKISYSQFSVFVTNTFQELMTPLTLLQNSIDKLDDTSKLFAPLIRVFKDNCRRISDAGSLAQSLDEQERDISAAVKKCVPVAIVPFFRNIFNSFIPYTEMHKNRLEISYFCDEYVCVYVFPPFMETLCYDIFSTALKHSSEGSSVSVMLDWDAFEEKLLYRVQVTGSNPVSRDCTDLISFRTSKMRDFRYSHIFNIGIDFIYRICTLYGGSFSIDCVPEPAADASESYSITFSAVLCLQSCDFDDMPQPPDTEPAGNFVQDIKQLYSIIGTVHPPPEILPVLYKSTILLVEDDLSLLHILSKLFAGYTHVITAVHGQSALSLMQKTVPDIVISDMSMPVMDGKTLYCRCRDQKRFCHIPFLFLTEVHDHSIKQELLADGAIDFITKPFNLEELFLKVCSVLSLCAGVRKNYAQIVSALVCDTAENSNSVLESDFCRSGAETESMSLQSARSILYAKRNLSPREIEIGELLYDNYSNKQIAKRLGIAVSTVATHIQHIYEKCNVRSRNEWIRFMTGY